MQSWRGWFWVTDRKMALGSSSLAHIRATEAQAAKFDLLAGSVCLDTIIFAAKIFLKHCNNDNNLKTKHSSFSSHYQSKK